MCLAVPLKIISIHQKTAVGEASGLRQTIRIDFIPELKCGDYVMVHAGFAIQKLTQEQAQENLSCIQEAIDAL